MESTKQPETKSEILWFLRDYVDNSTCSQGKGVIEGGLPTGGCGDPHYLSRDTLFNLIERIGKGTLTEDDLDKWER